MCVHWLVMTRNKLQPFRVSSACTTSKVGAASVVCSNLKPQHQATVKLDTLREADRGGGGHWRLEGAVWRQESWRRLSVRTTSGRLATAWMGWTTHWLSGLTLHSQSHSSLHPGLNYTRSPDRIYVHIHTYICIVCITIAHAQYFVFIKKKIILILSW